MSAVVKLHFLVVGSGPAGLCTALSLAKSGHTITVLEAGEDLTLLGAGLTIQPADRKPCNGSASEIGSKNTELRITSSILLDVNATGEVLAADSFGNVENTFGAASYSVHRGHLIKNLYDVAVQHDNISIRFNARVLTVNPGSETSQPSVSLFNGEIIPGDVVVGADGVKSAVRSTVTGQSDRASDTGDAAYRAIIPTNLLLSDPDLAHFVKETDMYVWFGPGRHVVAYSVNAKKDYNLVMLHKRKDNTEESWTQTGNPDKMRELFTDFEPRVQKLLALVDSVYLWKLVDRPPISNWVHESGKVFVIGDACHPVLPYRAQGANLAIEDAEMIGALFSHITSKAQIKEFTMALQFLRAPRCKDAVEGARRNQGLAHVADGPEQEKRDAALKKDAETLGKLSSFFTYDALAEVDAWWEARKA